MRRRRFALVGCGIVLCGVPVAVALADGVIGPIAPPDPGAGRSANPAPGAAPPESSTAHVQAAKGSRLPCTGVRQALNFSSAWAGRTSDGLKLTAVIRRCDTPRADEPLRANYVSYIYGECKAEGDAGCAPPIEIQSWPAAERNKATLTSAPSRGAYPGTDTTVAGQPATGYEDGRRVEIYDPGATFVIFGNDPARVKRIAAALVKAPAVLTGLSRHGIGFPAGCQDASYCTAAAVR